VTDISQTFRILSDVTGDNFTFVVPMQFWGRCM